MRPQDFSFKEAGCPDQDRAMAGSGETLNNSSRRDILAQRAMVLPWWEAAQAVTGCGHAEGWPWSAGDSEQRCIYEI